MDFCWVTVNVNDMEESLEFYKGIVELSVDRMMKPNGNMQIAFLGDGETKVELIFDKAEQPRSFGRDISIGFKTDSLDALMRKLEDSGIPFEGPFQPNPVTKFLFIRDPNGLRVQFVETGSRPE